MSEVQRRIQRVTECLTTVVVRKDAPLPCQTLQDRMAHDHVPGVSVAVIHDGAVEWAKGFGVVQLGGAAVTTDTLFQAGSISKPVAALAALRLVEQGKLSLDTDVNEALKSWKIPASTVASAAVVTLRELLTHTSGLTLHGFPGYDADAPIPTLVQILDGEKPANTGPIRLEAPPGGRWKYSGGGYTVLQQLLIDVAQRPFPELMRDTVLTPIGMTRSTYEQPLPALLRPGAATPYADDGTPIKGGSHTYPEMAAAGLWTTPINLARFAIEIQRSLRGNANHVISAQTATQMLARGRGDWGLGLAIGGHPENPFFLHDGVDAGFESLLVAYRNTGDGAVVMTNAQGGMSLAWAIVRSVASVYDWPDFRPTARAVVDVDRTILRSYVGIYELTPSSSVTVSLDGGQLMAHITGQDNVPIFPESSTEFFMTGSRDQLEFFKDTDGKGSYLVLHRGRQDLRAART